MTKIAIVYFSGSGHTHLMAEAVATGTQKLADTNVELLRITGEQIIDGRWSNPEIIEKLLTADAIVFGSPTYMGGIAAQLKSFIDNTAGAWARQLWKDKIAGGFTHSGAPSGDKQGTLLYLAINATQHSMIWVGASEMRDSSGINRLGSYLGVMGQSEFDRTGTTAILDESDRLTAEHYGHRIALAARRWQK
jgi:NAD(P)H dehydrogenase (quinone)